MTAHLFYESLAKLEVAEVLRYSVKTFFGCLINLTNFGHRLWDFLWCYNCDSDCGELFQ
jgi:hypothetical protein